MFSEKNLIVDTSVLIDSPNIFFELENKNLFIPVEVLEELDNHKTRRDKVGKHARQVNKLLDELRKNGSLFKGSVLYNGTKVICVSGKGYVHKSFKDGSYDNRIISTAYKLQQEVNRKLGNMNKIFGLLSNDIAFRVKCDALGLPSYSYSGEGLVTDIYQGIREIIVLQEELDEFYQHGVIHLSGEDFVKNECVLMRSPISSALGVAESEEVVRRLKYAGSKGFSIEGIKPRNAEQVFAYEALLDPAISLLTLSGIAGTGKTLLAISAAIHGLHNGDYDKIVITRPLESSSKDIGFLPGDKDEKMRPWVQPIFDNLGIIYSKKNSKVYFEKLFEDGRIEVEALTYIRGRSLPRTFFIVDEAQNVSYDEAKAIITRMGEDSKLVLTGDLEQIDSPNLNELTSGLSHIIEIFKEFNGAMHLMLRKGERSALAAFAAENM